MTAEIPKPAEIRKTKGYLWRRIASKWPFLIWLGVALLTYQLYQRGVRFERMNGVVVAETETIAALEDGVISALSIAEIGDAVTPGQIVVQIDPRMAEGELEEKEQEIQFDKIEQARKFGSMKTQLIADIAKLKAEQAGDEARAEVLEKSLANLKSRASEGLVPQSVVTEAQVEIETLRASLPFYTTRLADLGEEMNSIEELLGKLKEFQDTAPVSLQILSERIDRMKLKSGSGGVVSDIFFRVGSVVKRGEPILNIINLKSRGARGFILEENADKVTVGMPIFISPTGNPGANLNPGKITFISPQITATPDVGSSVAGRMIKGREITCSFDNPEIELLPGQSVTIHLEKPGKFKPFSFGAGK
ncbi:MAG: HlyD family secretion protein [Verrucomicrobiales bacterium]